MSFSAVYPTNFTVRLRKTTTISTICTYYREILTVRALRSSRTIEYYVLLRLRTIEKRKDWIWIGFQSGPAFFCTYYRELRTMGCTYYREMSICPRKPSTCPKWKVMLSLEFLLTQQLGLWQDSKSSGPNLIFHNFSCGIYLQRRIAVFGFLQAFRKSYFYWLSTRGTNRFLILNRDCQ